MGSLSDSRDFGVTPVGGDQFFGADMTGPGRWATIAELGVLWTNDSDSVQLIRASSGDDVDVYDLSKTLIDYCTVGFTATEAFDTLLGEYGNPPIASGDLAQLR